MEIFGPVIFNKLAHFHHSVLLKICIKVSKMKFGYLLVVPSSYLHACMASVLQAMLTIMLDKLAQFFDFVTV